VRLSSFRVRVFRNIIDSGEIKVDDVTEHVPRGVEIEVAVLLPSSAAVGSV